VNIQRCFGARFAGHSIRFAGKLTAYPVQNLWKGWNDGIGIAQVDVTSLGPATRWWFTRIRPGPSGIRASGRDEAD